MTLLGVVSSKQPLRRCLYSICKRSLASKRSVTSEALLSDDAVESPRVDVVSWGTQPLLLRLFPRTWGPLLKLPTENIQHHTGTRLPDVLGLIRQPFSSNHEDFSLHSMLSMPDPRVKHCYVSSRLFRSVQERCLVDEYYKRSPDSFHLRHSSIDLLHYLKHKGFSLTYLPDSEFVKGVRGRRQKQSTGSVLMVSPTGFEFNSEAAQDNAFMSSHLDQLGENCLTSTALYQFQKLHRVMTEDAGIHVALFEHDPESATPDSVFPNNWFSTHAVDSQDPYSLVLYPLKCGNRRRERRAQIVEYIQDVTEGKGLLDLRGYEREGRYLEGTGCLILDRLNRIAYVSRSERSDIGLAHIWAKHMGYHDVVHFDAVDTRGRPVYHTNVLMSIGTHYAIICLEAIPDSKERNYVMDQLSRSRRVIPITQAQMASFCGNVIELRNGHGLPVLMMSSQAFHAFTEEQKAVLQQCVASLHHAPIDTLERIGGGSVRCSIAEMFQKNIL